MSDAHAHDHDHPPFLQHHWENPKQQFEAGKLGMWLFLATEVLLFGGLFCGYAIWRANHPEMFKFGSTFLDTTMGAINTAVLIASSLTMAAAVTMI
ncbi:MAG: cytochrome c oxidase subunit 3 family protein, partial [Planctomycetota bacterium]